MITTVRDGPHSCYQRLRCDIISCPATLPYSTRYTHAQARAHAHLEHGWTCTADGDYCPSHALGGPWQASGGCAGSIIIALAYAAAVGAAMAGAAAAGPVGLAAAVPPLAVIALARRHL